MNSPKTFTFFLFILLPFLEVSAQPAELTDRDTIHYGKNFAAGTRLQLRGISFYFETYGQGKPILMIHGNGGSIADFSNQIPYFSKKYRVIAVDSRAQGNSNDLSDSLSFEMMADDFSALLDALHIDSCFVLGWSDGGINGLLLAIRHPQKVRKLAVTGANLWPDSTAIRAADYISGLSWVGRLEKMEPTPSVKNQLKLARLDAYQPYITTKQLGTIHCPSLIIGGDHDIILPQHTVLIAKSIPGSLLWILPDCGHGTLIEYKDKFNETVDRFFSGKSKKN
jgi:pimeloyl-ACP methyl ester carboxylesterase